MSSPSFDKNRLYILTILEAIEKLRIYAGNYTSAENFFSANDQQAFNASCHLLLAIGEETKKLDESLKDGFSFIQWEQIASMRNRIAHDYRGIDPQVVFTIIHNELGILKEAMIRMLWLTGISKNELTGYLQSDYYSHLDYLLQ